MKIHADTLTTLDILQAARKAGADVADVTSHGSRSRDHAFNVTLSGSGRTGNRWGNSGTHGRSDEKAATWDQWGMFLSELFARDASLTIPRVYDSGEHFDWATGGQYRNGSISGRQMHNAHRWDTHGCVTGSYTVSRCNCGAVRRFMSYGVPFATISSVA